jgi:heptaprenylglyceryl phosphate synthase
MSPVKNHIQDIDANLVNSVMNSEQQKFYKRHNHCCLCSTKLAIDIKANTEGHSVFEKITCPKCKVTISTSEHTIS